MINERRHLSIGAPRAQKIVGLVFALVLAAAGAAFAVLPLIADGWLGTVVDADESCPSPGEISGIPEDLLPPSVRECVADGSWFTGGDGFGPMRLIALFGIPFILIGLYLAASTLRTAAWLEGTNATVRRALRTRTVDLATATVTAGVNTYQRGAEGSKKTVERVPTVIARDPATGHVVTIPLHGIGMAQLPPAELRALADAITANPDRDARNLAAQLRTMADRPLEVL